MWTAVEPMAFHGLSDLALTQSPRASHTLYGTEVSARRLRARMLASPCIVALSDPPGLPLDADVRERAKRAVLRTYFSVCDSTAVNGARITVYARPGRC
ncbi:hypothetical protein [Streptomyces avermitilis]|uniref:hypothetical protein n=1 Tax=Streptomyces avermitilis TaxID=33903 RepID=UPI003812C0BB